MLKRINSESTIVAALRSVTIRLRPSRAEGRFHIAGAVAMAAGPVVERLGDQEPLFGLGLESASRNAKMSAKIERRAG